MSTENDPWWIRLTLRMAPHDWRLDLVRTDPHNYLKARPALHLAREAHARLDEPEAGG